MCVLYPYQCSEDAKRLSPITQMIKDKLAEFPDEGTPILLIPY